MSDGLDVMRRHGAALVVRRVGCSIWHYGAQFFKEQSGGSFKPASVIVPLVLRIFKVNSVVDVGCGVGAWLNEFATNGVSDYLGIDGDYVPRDQLKIPSERFKSMDLRSITEIRFGVFVRGGRAFARE
ncbi:methyltransferase domain-containing protein [Bradyrhizobium sp. 180]|uniref:methyltransferase domain-containing protein n=1 Tax=unclassified Bradyrhizobium TaxID=2631580 RepID=UPI001FF7474F|nr:MULTISPECIES: methyltransferase domain-containing protein [unclassified Bradyrhizobium]MCK1420889.1 methyltransferase domain-containing protein [Bradyrhizobium sp. CW12]MCK1493528.1 methyltransferase domain-containing protein [Bradyrhizobium sp. 180]MCK1526266.1 methyltransferase domain-containing protein [Bradyrhizobium sp. 182]MCK1595930.1 methyltransferase domain-containing protein [Bradyrhizobium sp. 164]MCK1647139.1 methyltransferase domain-containing protein [Bradyrhizobium sp. 154]